MSVTALLIPGDVNMDRLPEWVDDGVELPECPFPGDGLFLGPGGPSSVQLRVTRRAFITTRGPRESTVDVLLWVRPFGVDQDGR